MGVYWEIVLADTEKLALEACSDYLRSLDLQPVVLDQKYVWRDEELHVETPITHELSLPEVAGIPWNTVMQWQSSESSLWFDLGFVEIEATRYGLLTISDRRLNDLYDTLRQRGLLPLDFMVSLFKSGGCKWIVASAESSYADLNSIHQCITHGQSPTATDSVRLVVGAGAAKLEMELSELALIDGVEVRSRWPFKNACA